MDKRAEMIRFGNDGWKTRYDDGFTLENAVRLADAIGYLWAQEREGATVYVGFDTRAHSEEYAREIAGVVASSGLVAKLCESTCPTPAVAWACAHDDAAVGALIVTASELPCDYGGLIVRSADGGPCSRDFLEEVEQEVPGTATENRGPVATCDVMSSYLEGLSASVDADAIAARRPKVVIDPMHGAARLCLAEFLRGLGCDVVEIHEQSNPEFGGIHPAPVNPWVDECEQAVLSEQADMGIVLDCDADRVAVVDELGHSMPVRDFVPFVLECLAVRGVPERRVVATLTSSALIERQASRLGMEFVPVSVGFPYIYSELAENDVALGAEEYGGVCVPSHLKERDGIYAALLVLERLCNADKSLSELLREQRGAIGTTKWRRRDVRIDAASAQALRNILPGINPPSIAGKTPCDVSHADGLKIGFDDGSWVLARLARTDPVVRVYAEAPTAAERDELIETVVDSLANDPMMSKSLIV